MKIIEAHYKGCIKQVMIDDDDFELVNQYHWYYIKQGYAYGYKPPFVKGVSKLVFMHRVILELEYGNSTEVDHIDHNGLNNQKSNLRKCTRLQNIHNIGKAKNTKSKYLGVSPTIPRKMVNGKLKFYAVVYQAKISINGKTTHLGLFKTEEDAAKCYDSYAVQQYGEFANLNFKNNENEKDIAL